MYTNVRDFLYSSLGESRFRPDSITYTLEEIGELVVEHILELDPNIVVDSPETQVLLALIRLYATI
jgi:hypothetical protein